MQETTGNPARKRKTWIIVFVVLLFLIAVFWSVDPSVFYILAGFSAFSVYKILEYRNKDVKGEQEPMYRQSAYGKPWFWQAAGNFFGKPDAYHAPRKQPRVVVFVVAGAVALMFMIVIFAIIVSGNPSATSAEAYQQANDFYNRQQYDSAVYFYRVAIAYDQDNADLYLERGNAFLNSNYPDSAFADYEKAIALRPDYKEAYYNKGLIYYNRKQYRNSINEIKRAVAIDPDYTDAMLLIGDDFYNQGQLDSAMTWYENAYSKGYRSAALSHVMAYIHDTKGNTQRAIPLYKEAVSYDTTRTGIYSRLGELVQGEEGKRYRQKAAQYP